MNKLYLDGPRRDDEHLHPNVPLLADVVAGQEYDGLQLAHNRLIGKDCLNFSKAPLTQDF